MIIFLYGPDEYRREEKKRTIISEFAAKHSGLAVLLIDCEEEGAADRLYEFSRSQPLFQAMTLSVVRAPFSLDPKRLKKLLEPFLHSRIATVLLTAEKKPTKELQFLLKSPVACEEFPLLIGAKWHSFIRNAAARIHLSLSADLERELAAAYEGNTWGLVTELEKLRFLGKSLHEPSKRVQLEMPYDYWTLLQGLLDRDLTRRLTALERLAASREPAAKTFHILAALSKEKAGHFAAYDLAVKSGKLDYEECLLDAVL